MTPEQILDLARERGVMIATAESCTGGLIAGALTDVAGASDVFDRGFVTYSNAAKTRMLGVPSELIARTGAVSEPVARAMAKGAIEKSEAWIGVAVTGIAGPGGSEHKPEGRVCFGLAIDGGETTSETVEFGSLGRREVRRASIEHALALLGAVLSQTA